MDNIIIALYIITYLIVYIFKIPGTEEIVSISSVFSVLVIIICLYKIVKDNNLKKFFVNNYYINSIILIYSLYKIFITIIVDRSLIIFTLSNVVPLITFGVLLYTLEGKANLNFKLVKIIKISMVSCFIISIIIYILGIDTMQISFNEIIKIIPGKENLDLYGERRLSFFFTHKSRFAVYILSLYMFVELFKFDRIKKIIFIVLSCILIFLSSSITVLGIYALVILINEIYNNKDIIKKYITKQVKIFGVISGIILISAFIYRLSIRTGVLTLGYRIPIWKAGLEYFGENPMGVIKQMDFFIISTGLNEGFNAFHSHNVFLQEMIGYGIPAFIMLIAIFVIICRQFYLINKRMFVIFIGIIIAFNFDYLIDMEYINMFWYLIPLAINTCKEDVIKD